MSISIEQLETALASNDVVTAEQILLDYFGKEPLTQKEQGQATGGALPEPGPPGPV